MQDNFIYGDEGLASRGKYSFTSIEPLSVRARY